MSNKLHKKTFLDMVIPWFWTFLHNFVTLSSFKILVNENANHLVTTENGITG